MEAKSGVPAAEYSSIPGHLAAAFSIPLSLSETLRLSFSTVGSQASCHQRIALICDDVQAKITQIFSFVSLSYRLLAVDEDDGTPLCVRRPNTLDQSGIDEHKPSDCPSQKSCLRRTKILSRIGSVHRAFSRAPYTGMWLLKNPAVLKISEVACTRSGKGPAYGTL